MHGCIVNKWQWGTWMKLSAGKIVRSTLQLAHLFETADLQWRVVTQRKEVSLPEPLVCDLQNWHNLSTWYVWGNKSNCLRKLGSTWALSMCSADLKTTCVLGMCFGIKFAMTSSKCSADLRAAWFANGFQITAKMLQNCTKMNLDEFGLNLNWIWIELVAKWF